MTGHIDNAIADMYEGQFRLSLILRYNGMIITRRSMFTCTPRFSLLVLCIQPLICSFSKWFSLLCLAYSKFIFAEVHLISIDLSC